MARDDTRSKKRTVRENDDRGVIVGSEIGVTIPVGDTTAHLRFSFWHERISEDSTQDGIARTAALVDEFNEAELEKRVRHYKRLILQIMNEKDPKKGKKR